MSSCIHNGDEELANLHGSENHGCIQEFYLVLFFKTFDVENRAHVRIMPSKCRNINGQELELVSQLHDPYPIFTVHDHFITIV